MEQPVWNFEQETGGERLDETGVNLGTFFDRMPDEKTQHYSSDWTDEQVIQGSLQRNKKADPTKPSKCGGLPNGRQNT
jgi:hypothetical protein